MKAVDLIKQIMEHEGLELNFEECNHEDIEYYLDYCSEGYTIYNWIQDTKENYPECFIRNAS